MIPNSAGTMALRGAALDHSGRRGSAVRASKPLVVSLFGTPVDVPPGAATPWAS